MVELLSYSDAQERCRVLKADDLVAHYSIIVPAGNHNFVGFHPSGRRFDVKREDGSSDLLDPKQILRNWMTAEASGATQWRSSLLEDSSHAEKMIAMGMLTGSLLKTLWETALVQLPSGRCFIEAVGTSRRIKDL